MSSKGISVRSYNNQEEMAEVPVLIRLTNELINTIRFALQRSGKNDMAFFVTDYNTKGETEQGEAIFEINRLEDIDRKTFYNVT